MEYKRDGKDCAYRCWSNMVVLSFAFTIHETQGQTLQRIILLLGRLPGMNVGRITWSLVYVALSRTRKLSHVKLFPTGSSKYYHPMYFAHLLKLSMPANLKNGTGLTLITVGTEIFSGRSMRRTLEKLRGDYNVLVRRVQSD